MSLTTTNEFQNAGIGAGGMFPGIGWGSGGGGLLEGIILAGLIGGDGFGRRRDDGDCCEDIKNNARNLAVLEGLSNNKDATVAEGRNLANAICESEKTNLQQFYAAAIQAANNTQSIKDQATGFAIVNDARFDALERAGVAQTAAIIAKLNQTEIDGLRDQLTLERTRVGRFESREDITQLGIAFGNQIQAANSNVVAVQTQIGQLTNYVRSLAEDIQFQKQGNRTVQFGTGNVATPTNTANQVGG